MPRKLTTEEFIEKAKKIFPEYDYSQVEYKSAYEDVKIICPKCGEQNIRAVYLTSGRGCKCFKNRYTTTFSKPPKIEEINIRFPNFEIHWETYKSCMEYLDITCKVCGKDFKRNYNNLKRYNQNCPYCSGNIKTLETVLQELHEKYGEEIFDFSLITNYKSNREKKRIICKKCGGIFFSDMHSMLADRGRKCPFCHDESKGEREIRLFLEKNGYVENVDFFKEKRFEECKDINTLPFDFFIPEKNLLIEYQGEQHYKCRFGNDKNAFKKIQNHDRIKKDFAISNEFSFLEIPYWDFKNIKEILYENIKKKC